MALDTIPFALPFIGAEEEEAALRVLRSGWLTTGREALAFEKEFADFLSVSGGPSPYCMAVNSATSGLRLALEACGVGLGDIALVPSYTFTSTAEVVRYLGAEPVFVDSLPGAFNIDPAVIEQTLARLARGEDPYSGKPSVNNAYLGHGRLSNSSGLSRAALKGFYPGACACPE